MTARDTALRTLTACRRKGAWMDLELKQNIPQAGLDRRDAALATRLCCGVIQNRMLLDHWIGGFLKGRLSDLQPVVLDILRLAVYQLRFLDKIPPSAAVNEAVDQAKRLANPRAAGLVNGVLRNILRHPEQLTLPEDLSLRYSHPRDLVELLADSLGQEKLEPLLRNHNAEPSTFAQLNPLRGSLAQVTDSLNRDGITALPHRWLPGCLILRGGSPEQTEAFRTGQIYIQDPAARLAVTAAGLAPGMRVLDCCAAPGGKSFAAAIDLEDRGSVTSCDIHPHKIALIEKGAARLGLQSVSARVRDASEPLPAWNSAFDAVLADVPCSGLGVIRKKPDIRYKDLAQARALPEIQLRILQNQANYVRPGGLLVYSTCTVLRRENEAVIRAFLQSRSDFSPEPFHLPGGLEAPAGQLTLLPCDHDTDGFFIARLRRAPSTGANDETRD